MFVYIVFILFLLQAGTEATKFKVKLMTIRKCKLPEAEWSPAYHPNVQFTINKLDRKTTVISANITVEKQIGPVSLTYRTYQLQQNAARNLIFKLEKEPCSNPITFRVFQLVHINITKNCFIPPGHYAFRNMNFDKLTWLLAKSRTAPGKYAYEVEFNDPKGVFTCYDLVCDLIELKR